MIHGLTYVPEGNDIDLPADFKRLKQQIPKVYSERDQSVLLAAFKRVRASFRIAVEIGVANHVDGASATHALLRELPRDMQYLGVDAKDKSGIRRDNVHTLRCDSSNIDDVMTEVERLRGERIIDFLHIDGWHSVAQIVKDWRYAEFVPAHGRIVLHDTNFHPGPVALLPAIDRDMFEVKQWFTDCADDWGITVVSRKCPVL